MEKTVDVEELMRANIRMFKRTGNEEYIWKAYQYKELLDIGREEFHKIYEMVEA